MIPLVALGVLFLAGCASEYSSRRKDEHPDKPAKPSKSLPEWTKDLGIKPGIAKRCSSIEDNARMFAEEAAIAGIVDHYCSYNAGPARREAKGTLFGGIPRYAVDYSGNETCVYVEMRWGAIQCARPDGKTEIITNPELGPL